jgi:hypothetical protein
MRYGITTDHEYNETHKRERLTIWSGGFSSDYEGEAYTLPKGDGYMVTLDHMTWTERVRVTCPTPRTDDTYVEIDAAINKAINAAVEKREAQKKD